MTATSRMTSNFTNDTRDINQIVGFNCLDGYAFLSQLVPDVSDYEALSGRTAECWHLPSLDFLGWMFNDDFSSDVRDCEGNYIDHVINAHRKTTFNKDL